MLLNTIPMLEAQASSELRSRASSRRPTTSFATSKTRPTGVERTARAMVRKVNDIRALQTDFIRRAGHATRGAANSDFQAVLFEQPYARINKVVERCGVSRPTATACLSALADAGLVQDLRLGRDRLFINREFLDLLVRRER